MGPIGPVGPVGPVGPIGPPGPGPGSHRRGATPPPPLGGRALGGPDPGCGLCEPPDGGRFCGEESEAAGTRRGG